MYYLYVQITATYKSWAHVCNRAVVAGRNGWGLLQRESIETLLKVDFLGCTYITPCWWKKELMMLMIIKMIIKLQKLWAKKVIPPS